MLNGLANRHFTCFPLVFNNRQFARQLICRWQAVYIYSLAGHWPGLPGHAYCKTAFRARAFAGIPLITTARTFHSAALSIPKITKKKPEITSESDPDMSICSHKTNGNREHLYLSILSTHFCYCFASILFGLMKKGDWNWKLERKKEKTPPILSLIYYGGPLCQVHPHFAWKKW